MTDQKHDAVRRAIGNQTAAREMASGEVPPCYISSRRDEPDGAWRTVREETNQVFVDTAQPSHVALPVQPGGVA